MLLQRSEFLLRALHRFDYLVCFHGHDPLDVLQLGEVLEDQPLSSGRPLWHLLGHKLREEFRLQIRQHCKVLLDRSKCQLGI